MGLSENDREPRSDPPPPAFIFNFHGIGEAPRTLPEAERAYWLTLAQFKAVLEQLMPLQHAAPFAIELTFDDGLKSDREIAVPLLLDHGLKARFFVLAGKVGQPAYASGSDLREMARLGMSIQSHGWDHLDLRRAGTKTLTRELAGSRRAIEDMTGSAVHDFAVPFGLYNKRIAREVRSSGYGAMFTSDRGLSLHGFLRPRNTITANNTNDAVVRLVAKESRRAAKLRRAVKTFIKLHS